MRRLIIAALALALSPSLVEACAVCLDSAYGDRSFKAAFVFLMLMPFAVAATIAAVLARRLRTPSSGRAGQSSVGAAGAEGQRSA